MFIKVIPVLLNLLYYITKQCFIMCLSVCELTSLSVWHVSSRDFVHRFRLVTIHLECWISWLTQYFKRPCVEFLPWNFILFLKKIIKPSLNIKMGVYAAFAKF